MTVLPYNRNGLGAFSIQLFIPVTLNKIMVFCNSQNITSTLRVSATRESLAVSRLSKPVGNLVRRVSPLGTRLPTGFAFSSKSARSCIIAWCFVKINWSFRLLLSVQEVSKESQELMRKALEEVKR